MLEIYVSSLKLGVDNAPNAPLHNTISSMKSVRLYSSSCLPSNQPNSISREPLLQKLAYLAKLIILQMTNTAAAGQWQRRPVEE